MNTPSSAAPPKDSEAAVAMADTLHQLRGGGWWRRVCGVGGGVGGPASVLGGQRRRSMAQHGAARRSMMRHMNTVTKLTSMLFE